MLRLTKLILLGFALQSILIDAITKEADSSDEDNDYPKLYNRLLEKQNPSANDPPETDSEGQTFKYPLAFTQIKIFNGGWVRSQSVRDLPIATNASSSLLRLEKYGVRELHWHDTAELGYVIRGAVRVQVVDADGRGFVGDIKQGDLYTFPEGLMHSLQGLGDYGALILAVFNSGAPATFNVDDWLRHLPLEVLAINFETSEKTFENIPKTNYYIFEGIPPEPLKKEQKYVANVTGTYPQSLIYLQEESPPNITRSFGTVRIVDSRNFPATATAAVIVKLKKGCIREVHWNFKDELIYIIEGKCRIGVFFGDGLARTQDLQEGDIAYVQAYRGYYIENRSDTDLKLIEVLPTPNFFHVSLAQNLAHFPQRLVHTNTHTDYGFIERIKKDEEYIYGT